MTEYALLCEQLNALTAGVEDTIANLSNASALLFQTLPELNWAGFYRVKGDALWLGPFQGRPACVKIPFGKGVCGTAWARQTSLRVDDVHAFPGHIACDGASRSELVIPLFCGGRVWGVLDLDSPRPARFTSADQAGLEAFCRALEGLLE